MTGCFRMKLEVTQRHIAFIRRVNGCVNVYTTSRHHRCNVTTYQHWCDVVSARCISCVARDVYTTSHYRRCNAKTLSQRCVSAEDKAKTLTRIRSWSGLFEPLLFAYTGMWHWSRLPVSKLVNKVRPKYNTSLPSELFYLSLGKNAYSI